MPSSLQTPREILDALLDGTPVAEIQAALDRLPVHERYAVLCRACSMQAEVAGNCEDVGKSVERVLMLNCPFHFSEQTCVQPIVTDRVLFQRVTPPSRAA